MHVYILNVYMWIQSISVHMCMWVEVWKVFLGWSLTYFCCIVLFYSSGIKIIMLFLLFSSSISTTFHFTLFVSFLITLCLSFCLPACLSSLPITNFHFGPFFFGYLVIYYPFLASFHLFFSFLCSISSLIGICCCSFLFLVFEFINEVGISNC